jgi:4'-phosphopantetheinyl transferase EntD
MGVYGFIRLFVKGRRGPESEFRISKSLMPLVYQHNINETTRLGIWHITEDDAFFLDWVPDKPGVTHPHKRLQHLAGRFLLRVLFDDFPLDEIRIADTRKPFLEQEQYHFSISHCGEFAAALVSSNYRVGVDIESIGPKIGRVKHKFIHPGEMTFLPAGVTTRQDRGEGQGATSVQEWLTMIWCAKEAIYKWFGSGQLDFRAHMQLAGPPVFQGDQSLEFPFLFLKGSSRVIAISGQFWEGKALAWLMTPASER